MTSGPGTTVNVSFFSRLKRAGEMIGTLLPALACICIIALPLLSGCVTESNYKVLSFFFDGVPPPGTAEKEVNGGGEKKKVREKAQPLKYAGHGPFTAKLCDACHNRSDNSLVMPVEQLCFKCHDLQINKTYVHGPVVSGGCRVCHNPHGSGYPFLLISEPLQFCRECHKSTFALAKELHASTTEQCTACHDAHSSNLPYLIKPAPTNGGGTAVAPGTPEREPEGGTG